VTTALRRWAARELIDFVADPGSYVSWDESFDVGAFPEQYRATLARAAERAHTDESVLTGRAEVHGRPIAVLVSEFDFLAGSIGRAAAVRIISAVRRATAESLPVLASTASGGTRMQEGTPAFVEMARISRALMDHRAAGLPYLVHLRHPTTGGVFASWGSLGHITVAEPGALISFLGPKVIEGLLGTKFPEGVQQAENLADKGVIDAVVAVEELPELLDRALAVLVDEAAPQTLPRHNAELGEPASAWASILRSRQPARAGIRDLLRYGCSSTVHLHGTGAGERDEAVIVALTRLDGYPCVMVGQDRGRQDDAHAMGPGALRQAQRGMRLADELGLPLVTVIDTSGVELSTRAEEGAVAGEVARCIATLTTMRVPTVSIILGQGCGGGALALLPADVVVAAENAWLSPLPPEGASIIMHGDTAHAAEVARAQRVRATDLLADGIVHHVVAEANAQSARDLAVALAAETSRVLRTVSFKR
jgi:acetyl-CoA carboxylase carboxyl transferase beta subunit